MFARYCSPSSNSSQSLTGNATAARAVVGVPLLFSGEYDASSQSD
jgi:hypothetical protein